MILPTGLANRCKARFRLEMLAAYAHWGESTRNQNVFDISRGQALQISETGGCDFNDHGYLEDSMVTFVVVNLLCSNLSCASGSSPYSGPQYDLVEDLRRTEPAVYAFFSSRLCRIEVAKPCTPWSDPTNEHLRLQAATSQIFWFARPPACDCLTRETKQQV